MKYDFFDYDSKTTLKEDDSEKSLEYSTLEETTVQEESKNEEIMEEEKEETIEEKHPTSQESLQVPNISDNGNESNPIHTPSNREESVNKEEHDDYNMNPDEPTLKNLTCTLSQWEENFLLTHTAVGVFNTANDYIQNYTEIYTFDFTDYYEPFTDDMRRELEQVLKEEFIHDLDTDIFYITTKSNNNVITLTATGKYEDLKTAFPEYFTPTGDFYFANFSANYVSEGYSCTIE